MDGEKSYPRPKDHLVQRAWLCGTEGMSCDVQCSELKRKKVKLEHLEEPDYIGFVEFGLNGRYSTMGNLGKILSKATVGSVLHFWKIPLDSLWRVTLRSDVLPGLRWDLNHDYSFPVHSDLSQSSF